MNLPKAFRERMHDRLGADYAAFCEALHAPPPVSIRFNPVKHDGTPPFPFVPWCPGACYLPERPSFTLDPLFHAGAYVVQEASSMLLDAAVRQLRGDVRPLRVLDLCASPGGKTTLLASLLPGGSLIVANEAIRSRTPALLEQTVKWGTGNIVVTNSDPAAFESLPSFFDLVVVDAPCSGEGLFRKQPEACRHWSEGNLKLCADRQKRILASAVSTLKPGGRLIYSTCTFNPAENEDNAEWLERELKVESWKLKVEASWGLEAVRTGSGIGWYCYPHKVKGEGFFMAAVRKQSEGQSGERAGGRKGNGGEWIPHNDGRELWSWLKNPDEMALLKNGQAILALLQPVAAALPMLRQRLKVLYAGVELARAGRKRFRPAHALAMYANLNAEVFPRAGLDREAALAYLRREAIPLPGTMKGMTLITFRDRPLGWANVLPGRVNNLYPKEWKIRSV